MMEIKMSLKQLQEAGVNLVGVANSHFCSITVWILNKYTDFQYV